MCVCARACSCYSCHMALAVLGCLCDFNLSSLDLGSLPCPALSCPGLPWPALAVHHFILIIVPSLCWASSLPSFLELYLIMLIFFSNCLIGTYWLCSFFPHCHLQISVPLSVLSFCSSFPLSWHCGTSSLHCFSVLFSPGSAPLSLSSLSLLISEGDGYGSCLCVYMCVCRLVHGAGRREMSIAIHLCYFPFPTILCE